MVSPMLSVPKKATMLGWLNFLRLATHQYLVKVLNQASVRCRGQKGAVTRHEDRDKLHATAAHKQQGWAKILKVKTETHSELKCGRPRHFGPKVCKKAQEEILYIQSSAEKHWNLKSSGDRFSSLYLTGTDLGQSYSRAWPYPPARLRSEWQEAVPDTFLGDYPRIDPQNQSCTARPLDPRRAGRASRPPQSCQASPEQRNAKMEHT